MRKAAIAFARSMLNPMPTLWKRLRPHSAAIPLTAVRIALELDSACNACSPGTGPISHASQQPPDRLLSLNFHFGCYNQIMHESVQSAPNGTSKQRHYDLVKDPLYYVTFGFFALLTTALPAALGQPNFLPIAQTVAITLFLAAPLRRGRIGTALLVLATWISLQLLVMIAGSALLPLVFERAIHDGFAYHRALLEWSATGLGLPGSILQNPGSRLVEFFGILLGSLLSAGLVGLWFLMRAVNQFGYGIGRLALEGPPGLLLGLMPWRLATLAGYAGLVAMLAQPLLVNIWRPTYYFARQRRLAAVSVALVAVGLVLEFLLPGLWRIFWVL